MHAEYDRIAGVVGRWNIGNERSRQSGPAGVARLLRADDRQVTARNH